MPAHLLLLLFALAYGSCPPGTIYESYFNKCYKLMTQPLSFLTAEQQCISIGGHLATISNAFENSYVSGIAAQGSSASTYWIGANLLMSSSWAWTNGDNFTYSNWADGQPSDPSAYQCGAVKNADNTWLKQLCGSPKPFVCNIDPNGAAPTSCPSQPTTTPSTGPVGCPNNAACPPGYSLFFISNEDSYYNQATICAQENAILSMPKSAEKNDFLASLCTSGSNPWLGLTCPTRNLTSCVWADGSAVSSGYSNFDQASPYIDYPVYLYSSDGSWRSYFSNGVAGRLCEKKATTTFALIEENRKRRPQVDGKTSPFSPDKQH